MQLWQTLLGDDLKTKSPEFHTGDTVRVFVKIKEQDKERLQPFEGIVISRRGEGMGQSFTVRKISYGVGVERIFPVFSPIVDHVELVNRGKIRKAKLFYLRGRTGKRSKVDLRTGNVTWGDSKLSETAGVKGSAPSPALTK